MAARTAGLLLFLGIYLTGPTLASEPELDTPDQHLKWSRRVDQNRDPQVTGSTRDRDDVYVDVRRRQCLPSSTPADDAFTASTGVEIC